MKTTLIGTILLLTLVVVFVFIWYGKVTLTEAGNYLGPLITALSGIGFILAKDEKKI